MNINKGLRRGVGGVVAAAALVALAMVPAGTASADDNIPIDQNANTTLKIEGKGSKLRGHYFTAMRIGAYGNAQTPAVGGGKLSSVGVDSSQVDAGSVPANEQIMQAMKDAYTTTSTSGSLPSGYANNPVGAVAVTWLGFPSSVAPPSGETADTTSNSSSAAWSGSLRKFVTTLTKNANFKNRLADPAHGHEVQASTTVLDDDDTTVQFSVKQGIYIIVDTTANHGAVNLTKIPASIPMLASTAVVDTASTPNVYDAFSTSPLVKLGEVSVKNDPLTVKKKMIAPTTGNASVGDTLTYMIVSKVPLTTGFSHYTYVVKDDPSDGLTYQGVTSIKIADNADFADTGIQHTLAGTDYTVSGGASSGDPVEFNFSGSIINFTQGTPSYYGDYFKITYTMKIDDSARENVQLQNGVSLTHSNDPSNPPTGDDGTPGDGTTTDVDNDGDPIGTVKTYMYGFGLADVDKNNHSTYLTGGEFQIKQGATVIKFMKLGDGTYQKAADQTATVDNSTVFDTLTPADGSGTGTYDLAVGRMRFTGLAEGTYTVVQNTVPVPYSALGKSTFTVTVSTDTPTTSVPDPSAEEPAYSNSHDGWDLVAEGNWDKAADPTHYILVQEINSFSQLPMTGGAGAIVVGLIVIALLGGAGALFIYTRRGEKALSQEG
ncbi:isopeptide-forming domain-containing fimbrial protein [Bifidobacterium sp. ESL0682]|uniref:isopeptide-forming domain-containing fimbrial protein n=1 Tax=Bifidobacterium sp. ESL0682 TaxID=2983212 RepID=UPI0023F92574|nr:isopeptide-forming domain-containing fimbrial protein [Bifidobacterium sp. ESL0682]WEV41547.1 isopeptide-forming domain-containing fimbrial protein [Bifidobacterium sp. ESL0682]